MLAVVMFSVGFAGVVTDCGLGVQVGVPEAWTGETEQESVTVVLDELEVEFTEMLELVICPGSTASAEGNAVRVKSTAV